MTALCCYLAVGFFFTLTVFLIERRDDFFEALDEIKYFLACTVFYPVVIIAKLLRIKRWKKKEAARRKKAAIIKDGLSKLP